MAADLLAVHNQPAALGSVQPAMLLPGLLVEEGRNAEEQLAVAGCCRGGGKRRGRLLQSLFVREGGCCCGGGARFHS